jgi:hypothetical protein
VYNVAKVVIKKIFFKNIIMQKQNKSSKHVCWGDCCCKKFTWHSVSRIFLAVAVFLLIFVVCLAAGISNHNKSRYFNERFNVGYGAQGEFFRGGCASQGVIVKTWAKEDGEKLMVLFGEIVKVEGNQITILDNGAKEQMLLSAVDTHITSGTTEVGLSYLKAGQGAVFTGVLDKDKQLTAKLIKLQ